MTARRCFGLALIGCCACACGSRSLEAIDLYPTSLSHDLVAHWSFDEGTGTTVRDESGNAHDATLTGGTWIQDGRFGGAIHFDDTQFASVGAFPQALSGWSVAAWVRLETYTQATENTSDENWGTIVSTEAGWENMDASVGTGGGWEVAIERTQGTPGLHFGFWKGPMKIDYYGESCFCLALSTWSQIVGVVDGAAATYSIYVNGGLFQTVSIATPIQPGNPLLTMGEWPFTGRYLRGDIDDIAIWRRPLEPAEVALLFEQPAPPPL